MRKVLLIALGVGHFGVLAQYAPMGGGTASGYGGGGYGGGAMIARVAVAPNGFNNGLQGLGGGGGGGLHGVTRRTFMGEPNALASQFFQSAGVPVGGTPMLGTAGGQANPGYANNQLAGAAPLPAAGKAPPLPAATLAGVAVPPDEAPAKSVAAGNPTQLPTQVSAVSTRSPHPASRAFATQPRRGTPLPAPTPRNPAVQRHR